MSEGTLATVHVGLDVHAASVRLAAVRADELLDERTLPYDHAAVGRALSGWPRVRCCYEAGPTGYGLARYPRSRGIACDVVAPGLVPVRAGDRVKTDSRDARKLARLHAGGLLEPIAVPSEQLEALRDLGIRSSSPARRDWPFATSRGSNDPSRSRGVRISTAPRSVCSVFGVDPLRTLPAVGTPPGGCPRCAVNSAPSAASITRPASSVIRPPGPAIWSGSTPSSASSSASRENNASRRSRTCSGSSLLARNGLRFCTHRSLDGAPAWIVSVNGVSSLALNGPVGHPGPHTEDRTEPRRWLGSVSFEVPPRHTHHSVAPAADTDRLQFVVRLLHDDNLNVRDRVAGLLVLLYAQMLTRIARLRHEDILTADGHVLLRLGGEPIRLPAPIAQLTLQLASRPPPASTAATTRSPWLFPGRQLNQPISPHQLSRRLTRLGIPSRPGRLGALIHLLHNVPAPVLGD